MTKKEMMTEALVNLADYELISVWNEYCDAHWYDDKIYYMDDLNDLYGDVTFTTAISSIDLTSFDLTDNYFTETIYGIRSFDVAADEVEISELADYIIENDDDLYCTELEELLGSDEFANAA